MSVRSSRRRRGDHCRCRWPLGTDLEPGASIGSHPRLAGAEHASVGRAVARARGRASHDAATDPRGVPTTASARCERSAIAASVVVPLLRGGRADRRDRASHGASSDRSPTSRSRCWRRSPTRPSSPSRTPASSRSWSSATASSPRRWSSRRPRARCCGSSPPRRPTSSRCSTRCVESAARLCERRLRMPSSGVDGRGLRAESLTAHSGPLLETSSSDIRLRRRSRIRRRAGARSSAGRSTSPTCQADPESEFDRSASSSSASGRIARRPAAPRGRRDRRHRAATAARSARSPTADRAAGDVRGPGRHRHRERPPVRGAAGAHGRAHALGRAATALGEVGQAVSSSLDLQEVLTTIVAHAVHLCRRRRRHDLRVRRGGRGRSSCGRDRNAGRAARDRPGTTAPPEARAPSGGSR